MADQKEVYAEAKGEGYDSKILRQVIRIRKMDRADRQEQEALLAIHFGNKRFIYNWGIDQSRERFPGYTTLANQLPDMKRSEEYSWLKATHSQVLQQALIDLGEAYQNFFDKRAGYPRFKGKRAKQSIRYPQPKADWISADQRRIRLPKVGSQPTISTSPWVSTSNNCSREKTKARRPSRSRPCCRTPRPSSK